MESISFIIGNSSLQICKKEPFKGSFLHSYNQILKIFFYGTAFTEPNTGKNNTIKTNNPSEQRYGAAEIQKNQNRHSQCYRASNQRQPPG